MRIGMYVCRIKNVGFYIKIQYIWLMNFTFRSDLQIIQIGNYISDAVIVFAMDADK